MDVLDAVFPPEECSHDEAAENYVKYGNPLGPVDYHPWYGDLPYLNASVLQQAHPLA